MTHSTGLELQSYRYPHGGGGVTSNAYKSKQEGISSIDDPKENSSRLNCL